MSKGVGDEFQIQTKYTRNSLGGHLDWANKPSTYKAYPYAKSIKLDKEIPTQSLPIADVLAKRKSIRSFSTRPVTVKELSFLLWASTGIQRKEHGYEFRTAPSAGALYPIETYVFVNKVENMLKGLYHYNIVDHTLEQLRLGDLGVELSDAALGQEMVALAPLVFIWSAVFERSKWKYRQRAYRYVYLDAGIIGENLALSATGIGLGSCQIGAFFDDEVNQILGLDGKDESAIYLSVVGFPSGRAQQY
jgi:SagB-type dehydrogenase family enzyme